MRPVILAVVVTLFALSLAAGIRFDPPNPTSRTVVIAHVVGSSCGTPTGVATRNGNSIAIAITFGQGCGFPVIGGFDLPFDLGILPPGVFDVVAKAENVPGTIGEAKLTVADAAAPFAVSPNVGSSVRSPVQIAGSAVAVCSTINREVVCETPVVTFGGSRAEISRTELGKVTVIAPAHDPGTVDVVVQNTGGTQTAVAAYHYFSDFEQPDGAFFERVLIPVLYSGPGSFGSQWQTELAMHNGNSFPLVQPSNDNLFSVPCFPECDSRPAPRSTVIVRGRNLSTGYVTYVPRQASQNLNFSLVVRDLSRDTTAFGTSVPVVRENEFYDRSFSIVNIPSDTRNRVALRLYGWVWEVRVNIVALTGPFVNQVLVYAVEHLQPASEHNIVFIGDLLTKYPEIVGKGPLRLDISGASPDGPLWGYVSITNNETQHVTVIAPE